MQAVHVATLEHLLSEQHDNIDAQPGASAALLSFVLAAYKVAVVCLLHAAEADSCCCLCDRLQDGRAAEADLKGLAEATGGKHTEHDLIRHNIVVFKGGEGAQQVWYYGLLLKPCACEQTASTAPSYCAGAGTVALSVKSCQTMC